MDEAAFTDEVFGIIEPALEAAGYTVLEGDTYTACIVAPDGKLHFDITLNLCS